MIIEYKYLFYDAKIRFFYKSTKFFYFFCKKSRKTIRESNNFAAIFIHNLVEIFKKFT